MTKADPPECVRYEEPFSPFFARFEREGYLEEEEPKELTQDGFQHQFGELLREAGEDAVKQAVEDLFLGEPSLRPSWCRDYSIDPLSWFAVYGFVTDRGRMTLGDLEDSQIEVAATAYQQNLSVRGRAALGRNIILNSFICF